MIKPKKNMTEQYILKHFSCWEMRESLYEIMNAADMYGYITEGESQYYHYYEELLQEISASASELFDDLRDLGNDEMNEYEGEEKIKEHIFDIYGVAMFGLNSKVLSLDGELGDYFYDPYSDKYAHEEVQKWLEKRTKKQLISEMSQVSMIFYRYLEIKASFDCITSVVSELDEKGAILKRLINDMNVKAQKLYDGEITEAEYDELTEQFPPKAWVY